VETPPIIVIPPLEETPMIVEPTPTAETPPIVVIPPAPETPPFMETPPTPMVDISYPTATSLPSPIETIEVAGSPAWVPTQPITPTVASTDALLFPTPIVEIPVPTTEPPTPETIQ
jgi:hypothetical protein